MPCQSLHDSVSDYQWGVNWEWSEHANEISSVECFPSSQLILLFEAGKHWRIFELSEFVWLHEGFHVIEGIVKEPVEDACDSTCNERNIDGSLFWRNSWRTQFFSKPFNCCEEEAKAWGFSDCGWALSSEKSSNSVLFKDFNSGI